jgi:hypothetical protein
MSGPTPSAANPPTNVPNATAPASAERDQLNSSVMGLRNTPMVGLICAADAKELNEMTATITHP